MQTTTLTTHHVWRWKGAKGMHVQPEWAWHYNMHSCLKRTCSITAKFVMTGRSFPTINKAAVVIFGRATIRL